MVFFSLRVFLFGVTVETLRGNAHSSHLWLCYLLPRLMELHRALEVGSLGGGGGDISLYTHSLSPAARPGRKTAPEAVSRSLGHLCEHRGDKTDSE